jgi:MoaA/NifB/PqqE/SkfB family radical SAM enzyme
MIGADGKLGRAVQLARRALPVAQLGMRRLIERKSPFQMTLSLTNRCNFRCEYCHLPLQERDEMTTQEWLAAIDEFVGGGMGRASLMGGEPLLRKDAGEIIRHLRRRGVHTSMNTNAWLIPARIDDVALLDLVCITLDGPEHVHDKQRHRGSYARVIEAIELLEKRGVPVVTMTVVTPTGADNVDHVLEVARKYKFKAFFQIEHQAEFDVALPVAPRLSDMRVTALAELLLARKAAGQPVGNARTILKAQRSRRYLGTCEDCWAGHYYGYVFSDGTVASCLFTQQQVPRGNGRSLGFLRAFHELAAPTGPGCSCVPTHEVNHILDFDPSVLFDALDIALR